MVRCDAVDREGRSVCGKGKGSGTSAVVSAVFEAIEHYCCLSLREKALLSGILGELPLDTEIIEGSPLFTERFRRIAPPLSRVLLKGLNSMGAAIAAPAFLLDPYFRSGSSREIGYLKATGLIQYATNSGAASGTTLEDARLHALMELVERDALSIEILSTIFSSNARPVRRIIVQSLTEQLLSYVDLAERETGGKVAIFYIASELPIPVVLARLSDPVDGAYGYFGSAAAVCLERAIESAVAEAVQGFHIDTSELSEPQLQARATEGSPYYDCLLEYGRFEYRGGLTDVRLCDIEAIIGSRDIQWQSIINSLDCAGIHVYERVIYANDVYVVQLYAPQLERFFLATAGLFVKPGQRGLKALT